MVVNIPLLADIFPSTTFQFIASLVDVYSCSLSHHSDGSQVSLACSARFRRYGPTASLNVYLVPTHKNARCRETGFAPPLLSLFDGRVQPLRIAVRLHSRILLVLDMVANN